MKQNNNYKQEAWQLNALYPALKAKEIDDDIGKIEALLKKTEGFREQLMEGVDAGIFCAILDNINELTTLIRRLGGFGSLSFAGNTQDQAAQNFSARIQQLSAEAQNRILFFTHWWKNAAEAEIKRLSAAAGDYAYWLEQVRLYKPYTLSENEEQIINLKDVNGAAALKRLYDTITNRYTYKITVDGEEKELTRGELAVYIRSIDPDMRAAAYQTQLKVYENDATVLGQIYQALVRDWHSENVTIRGFKEPLAARNLANHIPDEVVDTLFDTYRANRPLFHRYFALKAKWLGMEKIRRYDIYAPLEKSEHLIPYPKAVELVLRSIDDFDAGMGQMARRVFDDHHIDSEVRRGKRSGAFCLTVSPDLTPWVLISYQGTANNVATLAHELGHAMHSMLAEDHTTLTQQSSLPLAETASTFAEMLLVDRLLADNNDPNLQRDVLFEQMDDAYATIARQLEFCMFERAAHEATQTGATVAEVSDMYLDMLQEQFGDSIELSDDFRHEWVAIPHFYAVPFYVYAYAFGQLLVLSLYKQFKQEGAAFIPRYKAILAAGGSDSPERVLQNAGIDMRSRDFWQGGFDVLTNAFSQLEKIPLESRL